MKIKSDRNIKTFRVREELKIGILELIHNFKSKNEPDYKKLTKDDVINVLSSLIASQTR